MLLLRARAMLVRDPERSRRVLRLIVANWLAYGDRPADQRPPLEPDSKLIYRADSSAPPSARMLTPEQLQSWLDSTVLLHALFPAVESVRRAIDRERSGQAALVLALANALYEREHGEPPDSPEQLVGPYLKALPPGLKKPEDGTPRLDERRP
jgi:hypothetical protein